MALTSPRFAWNLTLQAASENNPPLRRGARGQAVRLVQQALIDLGYPMPISTRLHGSPDGIYGSETVGKIRQFQRRWGLRPDGITGRNTLRRMDQLLPNAAPALPPLPVNVRYVVIPPLPNVIRQPTPRVCWATAYTMMASWNDQTSYAIRDAVATVGSRYVTYYDNDRGLPPSEFGPFLRAAGMDHEPMANLTIEGWEEKLRAYGLLWVGAMFSVTRGLHSRILEGIRGDGSYDNTWMMLADPWDGLRHEEAFSRFLHKYEGAIRGRTSEYYQIRHF